MKCPNCGNEVNDNFCTNCGTRVIKEDEPVMENVEQEAEEEETDEEEETIGGALADLLFEPALGIGFSIYYKCGLVTPILYTITNIIRFIFDKKKIKIGKIITDIICFVLGALCLWHIYNGYQDNKYIKIAKKATYESIAENYEWLFDEFSRSDVEWKCKERKSFTIVDPVSDHDTSGSYEAVVTVKGSCTVYNEPASYKLTFYVSEDKTVPVKLILDGDTYSDSEDIDSFIWLVYENDIDDKH